MMRELRNNGSVTCLSIDRYPDDVSVNSGQTALSAMSSRRSRVESQFQVLVIDDDQMETMRRQKQHKQQKHQQRPKSSPSKKERQETLRELESSGSKVSAKSWDLESSGRLSVKNACVTCVECPVTGSTSTADGVEPKLKTRTSSTMTSTTEGAACAHGIGRCNFDRETSARPSRPLEFLSLSGCYRITDDELWHLVNAGGDGDGEEKVEAGLPRLKHLDLSGCMNVSVEGLLPVLETCPLINFSHLFYCDNVFLGEGIDDLASGCRNLARGSNRVCCRSGQ